jgi:hypothetical protein
MPTVQKVSRESWLTSAVQELTWQAGVSDNAVAVRTYSKDPSVGAKVQSFPIALDRRWFSDRVSVKV